MIEIWRQLQEILQENNAKAIANLNPPASQEDLASFESKYNCKLPQDMKEFYLLCNGTNRMSFYSGTDICQLLSIEQISEHIELREQMRKSRLGSSYRRLPLTKIPYLYYPTGAYNDLELDTGESYFTKHDETDLQPRLLSLRHFLTIMLQRLQSGQYYLEENGFIYEQSNDVIFEKIRSKFVERNTSSVEVLQPGARMFKDIYPFQEQMSDYFPDFDYHIALPLEFRDLYRCANGQCVDYPLFRYQKQDFYFYSLAEIANLLGEYKKEYEMLGVPMLAYEQGFVWLDRSTAELRFADGTLLSAGVKDFFCSSELLYR
ncbi:MAG: SMI1/KNR4 family protein [Spirochaetota bacterium]